VAYCGSSYGGQVFVAENLLYFIFIHRKLSDRGIEDGHKKGISIYGHKKTQKYTIKRV
jgi:hypothetical protein